MANSGGIVADGTGLVELARSMLVSGGGGEPGGDASLGGDDRPVLSLSDLVGDASGEIVLGPVDGVPAVLVEADSAVIGRGIADPHVTASGDDVAGHGYVAFASGLTLYFPADLDVALTTALA